MAYYAIIRIDKCKLGAVGKLCMHHERMKENYKTNEDIDTDKSYLNYHLINPPDRYNRAILNRIESVGAKRRKDSIVMQDGLITASPEWYQTKTPAEIEEYFQYSLEFIKKRYGEENIISAVVHLDETSPHMHFVFVPITKDGRLSSKDVMGGPKGMQQLQEDFFRYENDKYHDFSRGIPARLTHRTHVPTYLYKNAQDLFDHYEEICEAINNIGMIGNAKKKDEAIALLGRYAPEMAKMDHQLKTTEKHMEKLEDDLADKSSLISRYREKNRDQKAQIDDLWEKMDELKKQQQALQKQIALVPPDLLKQLEEAEKERRRKERQKQRGYER